MELTPDLISIQGILTSVVKETGDFTLIRYKDGNQEKINKIQNKLEEFLVAKGYIKNKKSIGKYDKELNDIVFFLTINSEFKNTLYIDEYFHLMNIIPKLSKCLLINIVVTLDLGINYLNAVQQLPIEFTHELLCEFLPCLKYTSPDVTLKNVCNIGQSVIKMIADIEKPDEVEEHIESTVRMTIKLLEMLNILNIDQANKCSSKKIYLHMGNTLFKLLELILYCPVNNFMLNKLFDSLLEITRGLLKAVTINVYCSWAETEFNDQTLQCAISFEAYLVVEKLQRSAPTEKLIEMLRNFARKPPTLQQTISTSDLSTIIKMVNRNDLNQKLWFKAFVNKNSQVFESDETRNCLKNWSRLCDVDDVAKLLYYFNKKMDKEARTIVIQCAFNLPLSDLSLLILRHFYEYGISNNLDDDKVLQDITLLMNKSTGEMDEIFLKNFLILVLKNPEQVFTYFYTECLKKSITSRNYKKLFVFLKEISRVESLSLKCLVKALQNFQVNNENKTCLVELLNILDETQCLAKNKIILEIILPRLEKSFACLDYKIMLTYLEVTNDLSPTFVVNVDFTAVFDIAVKILNHCRCKFFEFSFVKANITKEVVLLMETCRKLITDATEIEEIVCTLIKESENKLNEFYFVNLLNTNVLLWDHVYPDCDITNHAETIAKLLKILPTCTLTEWLNIFLTLQSRQGADKTMDMFTDSLILMCQVAKSQENKNENVPVFIALKYCLQNYSVVLKECIDSKTNKVEYEANAAKCIVKLLREIPDKLQHEDGLVIISIIPDEVLKSLAKSKSFVHSVAAIKNTQVCQYLAQKMLN